ncbi:uncharacterized protein LOC105829433 isoform X6 [Monomorium pharaonis]|uniref:uncharacterized protein LOC105829433 isoform X6 n=1 Tax=Monomorium pharaonis TaxID=307658 RepID=UPI001746852E|nr:uncharacterized protein LOC105829433 isoform X6 [Monomorium pharaonis]
MSGSDGEDGRREESTAAAAAAAAIATATATTTTTIITTATTVTTITGESDGIAGAMGDECDGPTAIATERCCNQDSIGVANRNESATWTHRDTDAPNDHENVFPTVTDYDPTGCGTTDQRVIDAFIRGARAADEDRRKSSRNSDALAKLYSSAAAIDSQSRFGKESCSCDSTADYKAKRDMFRDELQKAMNFQNLWTELRQYIRTDFNVALETTHIFDSLQSSHRDKFPSDMHETVIQLCKRDSHQLFMRLVSQAQEFVIEVKIRLFALLHDHSVNLAEIFLTGLLNDYDALVSTAILISELVKPLKKCLNFNLTWDCFIKKLYQIYVYNDALVQNNLPTFIGQLRKLLPLKGSKYQALVHRYLSFDDEMTRIGNLWPETESWMDKYNAEQAVRMARLRQIREAWELFTATRKFMERSMLNKTSDIGNEMQEIHGQFSSLIAHTSGNDSPPLNPVLDFNSDSMPSSIEIVQILLDDWNKAQHQKLADIAGALTATEADVTGQGDSNCYDYTRTTCQLAQYAIRSVRSHSDDSGDTENGLENGKACEYSTCNEIGVSCMDIQYKNETIEKVEANSFSSLSNGFPEIPTNCTINQVKKKLDNSNGEDRKKKELDMRDALHKYTGSKTAESDTCLCVYQHAQEIAERKKEILESPPCPCLLNSRRKWDGKCPCLPKSIPETIVANGRPKATSPTSIVKTNPESNQKPAVKAGSTQSAQTQTRHSTTQTHNHSMHQGRCNTHSHAHGPLPDLTKNTGPCSHPRLRPLNHTPHACHKQANVEHIKRMSCNDLSSGDGDCSDSGSSQGDSCSTSSSAQRDTNMRHCDCCYCEVFGHGMPSVAPVSRNYKEMRERLRQLLTKKKAKKCKTVTSGCSPQKSPSQSSISNVNSESKPVTNSIVRSNTPISTTPTIQYDQQRDQRDLEELLEFIEGNQSGKKDNKKAEKKARQKQRKLEEKLKKDRQEAEKQKLIELQKKTPEVTITVVDPQKPMPQRLLPQCNLPEVSILPTSPSVSLPVVKQLNNRKKDKQDVCSNSNCGNNSITNLSNKIKMTSMNSNAKNKTINSAEKCDVRNTNSSQGSKNNVKNEKVESNNKGSKPLTSINNITKNSSINNVNNKLSDVDLLDKKLTKKERKKLKKEMKKLEEAKAKEAENAAQTESQPQIVTIRREINSNSAEPTVTITLKGQTPAEDKVLFTLVNGQTKEPHKSEQEQNQSNNGKKKKIKAINNNNSLQQGNKLQQSNNSKQQTQTKANDSKNLKQQGSSDKSKNSKQTEERKVQQNVNEGKNSKSKREKRNTENKENVLQQQNIVNKSKNQQSATSKKQNKANTPPQTPVSQKKQQQSQIINESTINKKAKKQQQQQDKNLQLNTSKSNKNNNNNANNKNVSNKSDSQKNNNINKTNQTTVSKQRVPAEVQNTCSERVSSPSLSSQFKDIGPNSKINIENLKLPPGITITKVDAPPKPLPIKTAPLPKPVNPPKQTTIIAAPMSGVQSSYASPQAGGNVIVVDTGKLKQDLLPKDNEKDSSKDSQHQNTVTGKKKKKKNKNSTNSGNTAATPVQNSDTFVNDHMDEPARILHNPGTNMVTIRNPSFGPMKVPPTQQAAIIKVSENGMVTIRSPALQQAINAGLTSPPKPDYIVKGDLSSSAGRATTTDCGQLSVKHANGVISSSLAELRSRLSSAQPDCASSLSELANMQINQMTNGQPIPENGINLKGTSVTLTKVRSEATNMEDARQASAKYASVKEATINATSVANGGSGISGGGVNGSGSGKSKKKKKRGSGTGQCGDDLDLVGEKQQ